MAQDFVGSNNINLLIPSGQFGTRLMGGSDAASPRYIFTHLSPIARLLFPEADDMLLNYKEEDGQQIEPEFFCPIIPLLLVNGCQGIGTGWSTFIPQHDPRDVLSYIRAKLDGENDKPSIRPWVNGFKGNLSADSSQGAYTTEGVINKTSRSSFEISELPVGVWTHDYKKTLVSMLSKGEIKSFTENHTTTSVKFDVKVNIAKLARLDKNDIHKFFKLRNALSTRNMHAFTPDMVIVKYDSPEQIADAFFPVRLDLYSDRKSVLESNMEYSAMLMRNKARFIEAVSEGKIDLLYGKKSKESAIDMLSELGFSTQSSLETIKKNNSVEKRRDNATIDQNAASPFEQDDERSSDKTRNRDYDYLLNMPLSSLTSEKIENLSDDASKMDKQLKNIRETSPSDLWREDLDRLEPHL